MRTICVPFELRACSWSIRKVGLKVGEPTTKRADPGKALLLAELKNLHRKLQPKVQKGRPVPALLVELIHPNFRLNFRVEVQKGTRRTGSQWKGSGKGRAGFRQRPGCIRA